MTALDLRITNLEQRLIRLRNTMLRYQQADDLGVAVTYLRRLLADLGTALGRLNAQLDRAETQMNAMEARLG